MLPSSLNRFFWDVTPHKLSLQKNARFIIERVLDRGDVAAVRWLFENFSEAEMVYTVESSRSLSPQSACFWTLYFNLQPDHVPCTQKFWPQKLKAVLQASKILLTTTS